MTKSLRNGLIWILICGGISIIWGYNIGQKGNGWVDFRAIYYGTRCLLQHHNPYDSKELEAVYLAESTERPFDTPEARKGIVVNINMPSSMILIVPLALLPWGAAHLLWLFFLATAYLLAAFLAWLMARKYMPRGSLFLICILLLNSESIFVTGNAAGLAVSFCVIAVWCLIEHRFVWCGVLCLAASLALKPHDSGFVWLFFLLAGVPYRKRALQKLLLATTLGLTAALWLSDIAPGWLGDWSSNIATTRTPGGINASVLGSTVNRTFATVIDLQSVISILKDDPVIYNTVSYLICGIMLFVWMIGTLRLRLTREGAWLAMASVVPLTMLITYHRPWDAKLLLICIPACAFLWAERGIIGRFALVITATAIVLTADISLAILTMLTKNLHFDLSTLGGKMQTVLLLRPTPLILLVMGIFYLWVYMRHTGQESQPTQEVATAASA
jgi:hypothetical protein